MSLHICNRASDCAWAKDCRHGRDHESKPSCKIPCGPIPVAECIPVEGEEGGRP